MVVRATNHFGGVDDTVSAMTHDGLPRMEFGFPGPLRDALVSAVLSGKKVSTSSLQREYEREGSPLPVPGRRSVVVDSLNRPVAVIEVTSVKVVRLGEIQESHALDEGEGYAKQLPNGASDMSRSGTAMK